MTTSKNIILPIARSIMGGNFSNFEINDLAQVALNWDFTNLDSYALDGTSIDSVTDRKAGLTATPLNDAFRMALVTDCINGLPGADSLSFGTYRERTAGLLKNATFLHTFAVIKPAGDYLTALGGSRNPFQSICGIGNTDTHALDIGSPPVIGTTNPLWGSRHWAADAEAAGLGMDTGRTSYFQNTALLLEVQHSSTGTRYWVGGVEVTPNVFNSATASTNLTPSGLGITSNDYCIGNICNGSGFVSANYFEGSYGQLVHMTSPLSAAELHQCRMYFKRKFNVLVQQPAEHLICMGQSNEESFGGIVADITTGYDVTSTVPNVFTSVLGNFAHYLTNNTSGESGGTFGPEQSLARYIKAQTGRPVFVNKRATGGTPATYWNPVTGDATQGGAKLAEDLTKAVAQASGMGMILQSPRFGVAQGEFEAVTSKAVAETLGSLWATNMAAWRSQVSYPNAQFVFGLLHPDSSPTWTPEANVSLRAAIDADANAYWYETGDFDISGDGIHYSADSVILSGTRRGGVMLTNTDYVVS